MKKTTFYIPFHLSEGRREGKKTFIITQKSVTRDDLEMAAAEKNECGCSRIRMRVHMRLLKLFQRNTLKKGNII